jgi:glycosyltransferase involved in cell wall biosynthesis
MKNHTFLIEIAMELVKIIPNSKLLLVGEGELKEKIKEKAKKLGILDYIIFYGVTTEIPPLLMAMDLFCFPSLFEGLGIAAIEAQAASLQTVASDAIPKATCISDQIRYLSLEDSSARWAEVISRYYKGYERIPIDSDHFAPEFNIITSVRKLENVYDHLIQGKVQDV